MVSDNFTWVTQAKTIVCGSFICYILLKAHPGKTCSSFPLHTGKLVEVEHSDWSGTFDAFTKLQETLIYLLRLGPEVFDLFLLSCSSVRICCWRQWESFYWLNKASAFHLLVSIHKNCTGHTPEPTDINGNVCTEFRGLWIGIIEQKEATQIQSCTVVSKIWKSNLKHHQFKILRFTLFWFWFLHPCSTVRLCFQVFICNHGGWTFVLWNSGNWCTFNHVTPGPGVAWKTPKYHKTCSKVQGLVTLWIRGEFSFKNPQNYTW